MNLRDIVHADPEIHSGTPVFVGTRVPVRILLDYLVGGDTLGEFLDNYPSVSREQAVGFLEAMGRIAIAMMQSGHGDYTRERQELFADLELEDLLAAVRQPKKE